MKNPFHNDEPQYNLRASDFKPWTGFFEYEERSESPPPNGIIEDSKAFSKYGLLLLYNLAIFPVSLTIGIKRGLEKIFDNPQTDEFNNSS